MIGTALAAGFERYRRLTPFRLVPAESPDVGNLRSAFRFQSDVLHDRVCLPQMMASLRQLALTTRAPRLDVADAQHSVGADDPAALAATISQIAPGRAARGSALVTG